MVASRLIDPGEKLDFALDWGDFLDDSGSPSDTIVGSTWAIDPLHTAISPNLTASSFSTRITSIFVDDPVLGQIYLLTNTITTAEGRVAERSITLRCHTR